jgi:hypothetical protein
MRIWIIIALSLLVGLIGGWAWTAAELGIRPGGGDRVEWGSPASSLVPPKPPSPGLAPQVVVEQDEFDFGNVELGDVGRHQFVIKNQGRGPLILTKGETSCVCTLSSIEQPEVPPGGSTKVEVEWHPKSHGPFRQSAQVLTNDPKRTRFELVVYGDVVSSYRIDPATIVFSGLAPNGTATSEARVYSYASDNLAIIDPQFSDKSTAQFYDLQIAPLSADQLKEDKGAKSGCSIKVTVKPGLPAGPFGERIRFHLNTPGDPEAEVTVEGRVNSPIEVSGANWDNAQGMLMLGTVHSREGAKSVIYLTLRGDALKQADVRLDKVLPETLKVTVGKTEKFGADAARVPLTIEIPPGSRPENHLGTELAKLARIFVDTGLSEPKQMRLLVRYAVEE